MNTSEVASSGYVPYHYRLLVLGKLQQVGRQVFGFPAISKRIRGLDGPAI
jgi:hypothetical protein